MSAKTTLKHKAPEMMEPTVRIALPLMDNQNKPTGAEESYSAKAKNMAPMTKTTLTKYS